MHIQLLFLLFLLPACSEVAQLAPVATPMPAATAPMSSGALEESDYLADRGEGRYVLAKLTTPASPATKGEAEFASVESGNRFWTAHFSQFRVPADNEIQAGSEVFVFDAENGWKEESNANPRESRNSAAGWPWHRVKVTDTSDAYKGVVSVETLYKEPTRRILLPR